MTAHYGETRARVLLMLRVPADKKEAFLQAYEKIRYAVAYGVDGHLVDQVCQGNSDPEQWLITSEWSSLASFEAWERDPSHQDLAGPLRACASEATSIRFLIRRESTRCREPLFGNGGPD
jgi:heme-degrading monooxygenase HmoA